MEKQIFINTFFNYDPFRPLSIKIILLFLNLILYMCVNGLFYGEDAISKIYHIEGDDPFFGFFPRSIRYSYLSSHWSNIEKFSMMSASVSCIVLVGSIVLNKHFNGPVKAFDKVFCLCHSIVRRK